MSYRLVTGSERASLLYRLPPPPVDNFPPYGVLVKDGPKEYLYFQKADYELLVIDVSGVAPAHFEQYYPAPASFWEEVAKRISNITETVGGAATGIPWIAVAFLAGVVFIVVMRR